MLLPFEEFIVIGVDEESLQSLPLDIPEDTQLRLPPKKLQAFKVQGSQTQIGEVVKDHCFPDGIPVKKLNYRIDMPVDCKNEELESIQKVLLS